MTARLALCAFAFAFAWALAAPALAAAAAPAPAPAKDKPAATAKAPAKGEKAAAAPAKAGKAKKKAAAEEAAPAIVVDGQPAGDDPEFAKAGKVIEFDGSGKAKVVRGTDTGEGELAQANLPVEELPPPMEERPGPPIGQAGQQPGAAGKGAGDLTGQEACRLRFLAQCEFLVRCSGGAFPIECEQLAAGCEDVEGMAGYSKKVAEACAKGVRALPCSAVSGQGLGGDPEAKVAACKPVRAAGGAQPAPKPGKGVPGAAPDLGDLGVDLGKVLGGGGLGQ